MPAVFQPPVVADVPRFLPETRGVARRVMRHYSPGLRGRSVVLIGSAYVTMDNPANDLLTGEEGVQYFLGGHVYVVSDAVAAALAADGYTVDLPGTWASHSSTLWGSLPDQFWAGV